MEGGIRKSRCWDKLSPDLLGQIFIKLSLLEILTVIPSVCKSWGQVVSGPYCWQDIDIIEWSRSRMSYTPRGCRHVHSVLLNGSKHIDRMVKILITRSCGTFRKLAVSSLSSDSMLSFIAARASCLQTLELPQSIISDSIVEHVAEKLSTITFLDISHCSPIGGRGIRAIGNHCKSLVGLRRIIDYKNIQEDDEAHAIATTMAKLKHLELGSPIITTVGVIEILTSCKELEFLDVSGCQNVTLEEKFLKERCSSGLKVLTPNYINNFNQSDYWDDDYLYNVVTYRDSVFDDSEYWDD